MECDPSVYLVRGEIIAGSDVVTQTSYVLLHHKLVNTYVRNQFVTDGKSLRISRSLFRHIKYKGSSSTKPFEKSSKTPLGFTVVAHTCLVKFLGIFFYLSRDEICIW
jgi:hypothetical protein